VKFAVYFCAFAVGLVALSEAPLAFAQQSGKVYRLAFLGAGNAHAYAYRVDALLAGLRTLGYVEGKNVVIEYRWAEGNLERLPQLARELVALKPDVLVTHSTPGARAAQQATATIPIVMTDVTDAVGTGLVSSLARPGGNVTGSSFQGPQLVAKRLEVLKEMAPKINRVALLAHPDSGPLPAIREALAAVAKDRNIEVLEFGVRQPSDFEAAFQSMATRAVDAVLVQEYPLFTVNTAALSALASRHRLPLAGFSEFAQNGALLGYGVDFPDMYRRAANFVDRIIKGARPADLPIEQPNKFELIVNLRTARALGITVPPSVLARADKVIE
jgi:putative tryptophan/tyrosine transport system substrate-binding protein